MNTITVERTVPRSMLLAGFEPYWIWDDMWREIHDLIPCRAHDLMAQILPDQEAEVMTWSLTY